MIESATRLLRRMFLSFTRPLAELTRICVPSKSHHTGALPGFHVGIAVPNHERSAHRNLIAPQDLVQQRRMGLLFRDTVAAQNRVGLLLNSPTLEDSVGEAM